MSAEAAANELRVESREEGPITRWVEVEVPAPRVATAFERAYRGLARSARVRGFRPGKAPRSVLQKMYGPAVAEDLERELVGETLAKALEKSGVEPVCQPQVESEPPAEGVPFVYRARVEVKPEFALGDLKGLPAQRPATAVSDEDVERELESVRQRHAQFVEEAEGVAAANGHLITMDFEGRIDGVPFEGGTAKDVTVELGVGQLIPGFDEQLVGALAGEERTVRVRFPDDYAQARPCRQGRRVPGARRVAATPRGAGARRRVRQGSRRRFRVARPGAREDPRIDGRVARARVERHAATLAARRADRARTLRRAAGARRGTTASPAAQRVARSGERGAGRAAVERQMARWEQEWRPLVEREVREEWLLAEVARVQAIAVDDDEVDARLDRMAEEQGTDAAKLRKAYREAGVLEAIRGQLLEEKAVEFLLGEAKVEEVVAS